MRTTISQKLGYEPAARFAYDASFSLALVAAGLGTVVHIVWFVTGFIGLRHRLDTATMVIVDWDPSVLMMHIRIGLALLISVVGLSSRRVVGLLLSALALVWVCVEYLTWYFWSIRLKSNAGLESFPASVTHASNLYGATPWNAVVLVLVIVALSWEIGRLIKLRKQPRIQPLNSDEVES